MNHESVPKLLMRKLFISKLFRVASWGVIKALQSSINMYFPSCLQLPTYSTFEALIGSWLGRHMRTDSP
jgi:hypothetical protein